MPTAGAPPVEDVFGVVAHPIRRRLLEELAVGTSTEDIALKFHVSPHTVRTHIKNILRKLDARTRAHAVAIAFSEDAINPDVSAES